jgi:outer membrane usher protein
VSDTTSALNRSRRGETGFAYDLGMSRVQDRKASASAVPSTRAEHGRYGIDAQDFDGRRNAALTVSGGLVAIGGGVHATRPVEGGFALVRLPGPGGDRESVARTARSAAPMRAARYW